MSLTKLIHGVIPAAGRGSRLSENGICKPFMKPLMAINGEPIVHRVARQMFESGVDIVTIVVSPENFDAIQYAARDLNARFSMQFDPSGPLDALAIGVADWPTDYTVMVSADNLLETSFIRNCITETSRDGGGTVGVDYVAREQVSRFSRLIYAEERWEEGPHVTEQALKYLVWAGPLVFETKLLSDVQRPLVGRESLIGPALNSLNITHYVQGTAFDIGVPEAWEEPVASN